MRWVTITVLASLTIANGAAAQTIPNIAGHYWCSGNCGGQTTIEQAGGAVTCINERNEVSYGRFTDRRTFVGCWNLRATVSEALDSIDWHNGTWWNKQH